MLRVFVYEYLTGGGMLGQDLPHASLLREGQAMVAALAADFLALPDVELAMMRDRRWRKTFPFTFSGACAFRNFQVHTVQSAAEERRTFLRLAGESDWTVVIAPEFDGILLERCAMVESCGRLLGPPTAMVQLASDKHATAQWLHQHGIPAPEGTLLQPGDKLPKDFCYPAVLKLNDGAGSLNVRRIERAPTTAMTITAPSRLEVFCQGTPASVAVISGTNERCILRPCRQHLSEDGKFSYLGGDLPLPAEVAARACRWAERVADLLPHALGYWGMDLVLGPDAASNVVIEINPRLTTSYVGLRAASKSNLAEGMLRLATGKNAEIAFRRARIEFDADGAVRSVAAKRTRTA